MRNGRLAALDTPAALIANADPFVRNLMQVPRRQAERLAAFMAGPARG
jgi:hypothetical protein